MSTVRDTRWPELADARSVGAPLAHPGLSLVTDGRGSVLWASESATRTFNVGQGDVWPGPSRSGEVPAERLPQRQDACAEPSTVQLLCSDGIYRSYSVERETVTLKPTRMRIKLTPCPVANDSGWLPSMISATEVIARAPMPFLLTDVDGTIFGANKAMKELVDTGRLSRKLAVYFNEEDWNLLMEAARRSDSVAPIHPEVQLRSAGSRITWVRAAVASVRGESQLIWQFIDITEERSQRLRTERRLRRMTEISQTLQRAILPPIPPQLGPLKIASVYRSATRYTQVGGDLYGAVGSRWGSRLIIGDVRGKGIDAVGTATYTLERFTVHSPTTRALANVAEKMDADLRSFDLASEGDFVTALLAEVSPHGRLLLIGCGHPDPWLIRDGAVHTLQLERTLPLGLGSKPRPVTVELEPGDRVVLFTDGLIEAREVCGGFIDPRMEGDWIREQDLRSSAEALVETVVNRATSDDVACVMFEYQPEPRRGWR